MRAQNEYMSVVAVPTRTLFPPKDFIHIERREGEDASRGANERTNSDAAVAVADIGGTIARRPTSKEGFRYAPCLVCKVNAVCT